jgi:hypothetical protein
VNVSHHSAKAGISAQRVAVSGLIETL